MSTNYQALDSRREGVDWRTLRDHRPAGAYYPIGALDGDCRQGDGEWPCAQAVRALQTYGIIVPASIKSSKAHALDTDGLYNYSCTGCDWRYPHVGWGEPDVVAKSKFDESHGIKEVAE